MTMTRKEALIAVLQLEMGERSWDEIADAHRIWGARIAIDEIKYRAFKKDISFEDALREVDESLRGSWTP